jgi:pyridoxamine 5'-phosphate oxidase
MTCEASCSQCLNNEEVLGKVKEYINQTKWIVLSTVTQDKVPVSRTMASVVNDGLNLYFSTGKNTAKVGQIASNPNVTLLFQHEEQELSNFKNVAYTGRAERIESEKDLARAIELLSNRSPRFKARVEKGQLGETAIFKVEPVSIKYLDYSQGVGPQAVTEIIL